MSFSLGKQLKFIDLFQFMSTSLATLVNNLKKSGIENFKCMKNEFGDDIELLLRKGMYPYSFMDNWDKFKLSPNALKQDDFIDDLTGKNISNDDFEFFNLVCNKMNIKNMGEYHDLYLKTDVLLLADVFENFRKVYNNYYKLDPCHYISSPGLSWDACFKMTKKELELLTEL